jgi:hypothetical protein
MLDVPSPARAAGLVPRNAKKQASTQFLDIFPSFRVGR